MAEILVGRDLINDSLGNWYVAIGIAGKKLILANAVVYYATNRIYSTEFAEEHKHETITQFATDIVKRHIKDLGEGNVPGGIYILESLVADGYDIVVDGLYERSAQVK